MWKPTHAWVISRLSEGNFVPANLAWLGPQAGSIVRQWPLRDRRSAARHGRPLRSGCLRGPSGLTRTAGR